METMARPHSFESPNLMADDVLVFLKKNWEKKCEKVKKTERKKKTKKNPLLYLEATYSPDFKHIRKKNKNTVSDD